MLFYYTVLFRYCCNITSSANSRKIFIVIMARKRKSKLKGIKKGTATDYGKDTENEVSINETLKTGADNVNENSERHEVETTELNKERNKRRKNTKVTEKTTSDQLNCTVDNGHEKKPEPEKQHDRAHAAMDTENEVPINETLKTGADNVNKDREGHEVETTELNKERNKRRKNTKVTEKTTSDQLNYAVDNGHEKKPEDEKQHDKAHAVMDKENESPINETLKTGADNVNDSDREGYEVETTELNKKRNKRRKNSKVTAKTPSDQLNNAVDNGHEKKPEDKKQHDRAHAVMDTENESPINETLKTGADNVNENGKGHEVKTAVLNKQRNTKRRNNKVTAKTPSDQLNYVVNNGHAKKPEAEKQHDRAHAVMDTENEVSINKTLKTGADNVNKDREGHEVETTELNKERNKRRKNTKVTEKTTSDQLNYAVDNGHEKQPEDEKQHDKAHAVMDKENESPINETLKTGADNVNDSDREGYEVETTELNKKRNKRRKNSKVTAKTPSDQLNNAVDNGHEKKPEDEKNRDRAHAVMDKETLKTGVDNVNGNGKGHEVETIELKKKRNTEMTVKAPSDQLNYATDNDHEKKPEDEKHYRTHAVMDTENESPINETLKTGADNVNEDGKGHEVEIVELNTKRRNNKVTAKALSDQLNYAMDNGHEKEPEAQKQHDRTHAGMNTEKEAPTKETLRTGPVTDNKNRKGHMNEVEATQSNKKRNTEATAKAPLASYQLNYAAQQDKSQAKVKGQGTNKGLDEKIKEWREVLKMVEEDEEDSVYSKTPPTKISSNGLHGGRGELGEASLNVEFNAQSELLLVGQLLGLPLLADSAKRSLKYIQQVYMMQHGGRLESNILTEADIANSATQFLVDIQLMPFAPSLGDFLPPPDPNSYVLQTDDVTKKVTKQTTAKKLKKKRKTFSCSNNDNCTAKSSLTSAETEEVVFVSKDVQETTSVEIIAISQDPQEVQTVRPPGSSSSLSPDENNVHVPDPSENLPVEENTKNTNEDTLEVFEVPAQPSQKDKKRSCTLCDFQGFKLARHMKKHVKEGKIRENEISLWVKKADFKERAAKNEKKTEQCESENEKKGSTSKSFQKHERNHYLCRWQGCTAVVNRPSQHLKRVHALCDEMAAFARRSMKLVDKGELQQAGTKRKASTSDSSGIQTTVSVEGLPPKGCTIREATGKAKKDPVIMRKTGTKRRASAIPRESLKATPLKKRKVEEDCGEYSSETEDDESVQYADSTSSEEFNPSRPSVKQNERMMEQIQMDLDDAQFVSGDESEDDDEGEVIAGKRKDQDWHDFYTDLVERSKTQRGQILAMFYDWLQPVEGGERKKIHSLQHVRQVHTILEVVEPNGDGLRPLTHDFGMAVWNEWAAPRLRTAKLSHGTVRNYILSLECFCQFLTTRRVAEKVDKFTIQRVQDLQTRLPKWRKTVHRRGAVEDTERFVKESEEALTPDDVKSLENSDHARQVIKNIAETADGNPVSKKQFTEIRDYLLTTLILHNGARTGVVENCTVKQFQSAKKDTEGNYVVLVTNHKTTRTFGPVRLTFKPSLYSYTAMYVQEMLPIFANPNGVLFPSNKGKSFRQSNVGKRVIKTFQRANIRMDINVTATRLRKFHTGRVFYRGADAQELVADHMAHLTTTARKKYRRVDLMERSTAAFRIMQENITGSPTATKDEKMCADDADDNKGFELGGDRANRKAGGANCEDDDSNGEDDGPDGEADGANGEGDNGNGKGDGANRKPDGANGVTDAASGAGDGANGEAADKHKGSDDEDGILTTLSTDAGHSITITDDEKAVLKTLFKKEIRQGLKMSEQMIRDKLKTDRALKLILVSKAKVRNVQRWILREQKKTAAASIANLPTMDAAEKTANYVATYGGQRKLASEKSSRQAWSMEDTKVIKRKFSELLAASETGSLTKSAIEAHWQKDDVLRAIYEREETFPGRTYIKVKTIFRWNSLV